MALNEEFRMIIATNFESVIFDWPTSHKIPIGVELVEVL